MTLSIWFPGDDQALSRATWRPRARAVAAALRLIATIEDPDAIRAILAAVAVSRALTDRAPPFAAPLDPSQTATIGA